MMDRSSDSPDLAQQLEVSRRALAAGDRVAARDALRMVVRLADERAPEEGPALYDVTLAATLARLGELEQELGSPDDAERQLARALALAERQYGPEHPDLVVLLNDVSRLLMRRGAHDQAEPLLERLYGIKRATKGEEHPETATVLASLATVRQLTGRHEAAEQLWRRVLAIRERTLAPNHVATAGALERLAEACTARGRPSEGVRLLQRALAMREITLDAGHPSLRAVRERIADLRLQASWGDTGDRAVGRVDHATPVGVTQLSSPATTSSPVSDTSAGVMAPTPLSLLPSTTSERPVSSPWRMPAPGPRVSPAAHGVPVDGHAAAESPAPARDLPSPSRSTLGAVPAPDQGSPWVRSVVDGSPEAHALGQLLQKSAEEEATGQAAEPSPAFRTIATLWQARRAPMLVGGAVVLLASMGAFALASRDAGAALPAPTASDAQVSLGASPETGPLAPGTQAALLIGRMPVPRYPPELRSSRLSGEVHVSFEVDTTGRVDMKTLQVLHSDHALFTTAVREVLPRMRFAPAEAGDGRVRWPVRMPFGFTAPR